MAAKKTCIDAGGIYVYSLRLRRRIEVNSRGIDLQSTEYILLNSMEIS